MATRAIISKRLARKLREPALLVPLRQPSSRLAVNPDHPLAANVLGFSSPLMLDTATRGATAVLKETHGGVGYGVNNNTVSTSKWELPQSAAASPRGECSVFCVFAGDPNNYVTGANDNGAVIYCERPNATQIMKIVAGQESTNIGFICRDAGSAGLIIDYNPAPLALDTGTDVHTTAISVASATSRTLYADNNSKTYTTNVPLNFNAVTPTVQMDPIDNKASNIGSATQLVITFDKAITAEEYDLLKRDPWGLFVSANDSPILIPGEPVVGGFQPAWAMNATITQGMPGVM